MSSRFFYRISPFFLGTIALSLSACALTRSKPAPEPATVVAPEEIPQPEEKKGRAIGTVAMVNEDLGFVLIEARELPPNNTPLQTVDASGAKNAKLLVSAEKQPPFLIADIVEGTPYAGEQVVISP